MFCGVLKNHSRPSVRCDSVTCKFSMGERVTDTTDIDVETSSVLSQILDSIVDFSSESNNSANRNYSNNLKPDDLVQQPTCSNVIQNENVDPASTKQDSDEPLPYQTRTMKDILNEILDCTVICRPSVQLPSTSTGDNRNLPCCSSPPPEYRLDPRRSSIHSASSKMQCTVKEVISEIMDYTVFKKMDRRVNVYDFSLPGTSRTRSEHLEHAEHLRGPEIYRILGPGIVNSANAIHDEEFLRKTSVLSIQRILPSYSSVIRMGPAPKVPKALSSCSFVPRKPPPSYAEVEGIWENSPSLISSESAVFGPDPTYMICPRCRTAVVTEVEVNRSIMTHLLALLLCLCLCWPCCLLPYCLRSCNYSHHSCPHCSYYFGVYRPF